MGKKVVFHYELSNAWLLPICEISVIKTDTSASAQYKIGCEKEKNIGLDHTIIQEINAVMENHTGIFKYRLHELEDEADLFDGVVNYFEFAALDGKSAQFLTFNIGEIHNPKARFIPSILDCSCAEHTNRNVIPIKAMEVVKTFEEIASILIKNGVPKDCFLLG